MIILQANTFSVQSPKAGNVEITSKDINKGTHSEGIWHYEFECRKRSPGSGLVCSGSERY